MPKLRETILKKQRGGPIETFTDRDERGNLSIWQEGGYDMDPYQAGIQDKPSVGAPVDPNKPPIYMTNIPQGGFDPSLDRPGGVPGSAQDRAELDAAAAAEGVDVMDLSEKKKTPEPPAWVNPNVDLNAPGERDRFKQGFREDMFGGIDLPDISPVEEAAKKWDPAIYPKEYKELADRLGARIKAAREVEDRVMAEFDKNAAIQLSMRKRKAESSTAQATKLKDDRAKYISLGQNYVKILADKQKLIESLDMMIDETAKGAVNAQIQELDSFANDIKYQMKELEKTPGIKPVKTPTKMAPSHGKTQPIESIAKAHNVPTQQATKDQAEVIRLGKEAKAKGLTGVKINEYIKQNWKGAGAVVSTGKAKVVGKPAKSMPSKPTGVKPAQPGPKPPEKKSLNVEAGPFKLDIDSMKAMAEDVGLGAKNWKSAVKLAADVGGFTVEELYTKPLAEIKRLLELAVSSQKKARKEMGL